MGLCVVSGVFIAACSPQSLSNVLGGLQVEEEDETSPLGGGNEPGGGAAADGSETRIVNCGPAGSLCICGTEDGTGCADSTARVDLYTPTFSKPTLIDNPLFSVSQIEQTLLLGHIDGVPFRVLYTLLPTTRRITWQGQSIETIQVQYVAHLDGRIEEYAIDWYAQADDGSVWYFGEDVFDYLDGVLVSTDGTWLVERDGPLAMIMPADPQVGDVYRVENIPFKVFEELTVVATDLVLEAPSGVVEGAIQVNQLGLKGTHSFKTFAPGYAEFLTSESSSLEALALALPTDAVGGPASAALNIILQGASSIYDAGPAGDCTALATTVAGMRSAWDAYAATDLPPWLATNLDDALNSLEDSVARCLTAEWRPDAVDVTTAALDLQSRHVPVATIDAQRFGWLVRQLELDVADGDIGGVRSDAILLRLNHNRIVHVPSAANATTADAELTTLKTAAEAGDLAAAGASASRLRTLVAGF